MHVFCAGCQAALADIAVEEPVMTPKRCTHRAPAVLGYHRREVMLVCDACDRVLFSAPVARRQAWRN
jgi:hypothetical protein